MSNERKEEKLPYEKPQMEVLEVDKDIITNSGEDPYMDDGYNLEFD